MSAEHLIDSDQEIMDTIEDRLTMDYGDLVVTDPFKRSVDFTLTDKQGKRVIVKVQLEDYIE